MINKKSMIGVLVILILGLLILIADYLHETNKDMNDIIESALEEKYKEKTAIEIFHINDIQDAVIVGFTYDDNNKIGYAVLKIDKYSRYSIIDIQVQENLITRASGVYYNNISLNNDNGDYEIWYIFLSNNSELSRIELTVNGGKTIDKEVESNPSLILIKIPNNSASFSSEILFVNKYGNLIS